MERSQAISVLETIDRMRPPFVEWRAAQARKLAAAHGTTERDEQRAMVDSFARTMAEIDFDEATAVVEAMEVGSVPTPFWSELATTIRTAAMEDRRGKRAAKRLERESSPRYHCPHCRDSGAVVAFYPPFVEWLRPHFEGYEASGFPHDWFDVAKRQWYGRLRRYEVRGPAEVCLACCCDGDAARVYQRQVAAMSETRNGPKPKRAAHVGVWNPDRQALSRGLPEDDLAAWYATHAAYEWAPADDEYASRFGVAEAAAT